MHTTIVIAVFCLFVSNLCDHRSQSLAKGLTKKVPRNEPLMPSRFLPTTHASLKIGISTYEKNSKKRNRHKYLSRSTHLKTSRAASATVMNQIPAVTHGCTGVLGEALLHSRIYRNIIFGVSETRVEILNSYSTIPRF